MRFKDYKYNWKKTYIGNISKCNPKSEPLKEQFIYIDLESVNKGRLLKSKILSRTNAPSRAQRVLHMNDILFQSVRPYQKNNYLFRIADGNQYVASTGYIQLRTNYNPLFIYQLLNTDRFIASVMLRCTGTSYPAINSNDFSTIPIYICKKEEQTKIANLLSKIDQRIDTQIKIINDLKFLKEGISNLIFKIPVIENSNKTLQNFLIEGDKTPVDTKKYRKITIKLNKQGIVYSDLTREMADTRPFYLRHKGELIIGKQNYFNGSIAIVDSQFDSCICSNAIMSFKVKNIDKNFLYYQISNNNYLNSQSYKANGTGQKELSEKEFLKFKVWCPSNELQKLIVCSIKGVDEKMNNEIIILKKYIEQKEYLLNNLFI